MAFDTDEKDLNTEEDTSTEDGHSDENDDSEESEVVSKETEEDVEGLKARLAKAESDRDNYKAGLLSQKAKERTLDIEDEVIVAAKSQGAVADHSQDTIDERIQSILNKERERGVLRTVIDKDSDYFIEELVDDNQYKEIIQYLPRRYDRSTEKGIVRGLKAAVSAWKTDKGFTEKTGKKSNPILADKTGSSSGEHQPRPVKKSGLSILKPTVSMTDWYKK